MGHTFARLSSRSVSSERDAGSVAKKGSIQRKQVQQVMVRTTVEVQRTMPFRPHLSEEPEVKVFGVVDLSPDPTIRSLPLRFVAWVKLYEDGTVEVLSFAPLKLTTGTAVKELIDIYEHAFANALVSTHLKILGVRP
tara:strand:- start:1775 stop:2185 length:411 start_codon:yes stop_codon:yes gene_type:complete